MIPLKGSQRILKVKLWGLSLNAISNENCFSKYLGINAFNLIGKNVVYIDIELRTSIG